MVFLGDYWILGEQAFHQDCRKLPATILVCPTLSCQLHSMSSASQRRFQFNLKNALEVKDTTGSWTVIVQVLVKYPTKTALKNPNMKFKKFLLTDMQGTAISAITFDAIDHFDRIFEPFKRYYVTSASVKVADPRYKVGNYNYEWTLYPRTHVQLVDEASLYTCPYSFDFMPYSEMFKVAERNVLIAVKGLVVHSIPVPNATKPFVRDYVLLDEAKRPTILRVWEDVFKEDESGITEKLPQPTFVAGFDLKVTTHNGLSITTSYTSHFMVSPPLREHEPLLAWYTDNADEVGQLIRSEAYKSTDVLLPPPLAADIVPMKTVSENMATLKTAWVSGRVCLLPAQNKLWHTICDKCHKTVSLPVGSDLPCTHCKKEMNVQARCHIHVFLNDASGTISATVFSRTAEKMIGHTALELIEAADKNTPMNDEIEKKLEKMEVTCFLKDYTKSYETRFERSFPVVTLHVKEKQMFSPSTKSVVDELATEIGVDEGLTLPNSTAKRAIVFATAADETTTLVCQEGAAAGREASTDVAGCESPNKKLKNAAGQE